VTERLDFAWEYDITPLATFRMLTRLEQLNERAKHLGHEGHSVLELRERQNTFRMVTQRRVDPELAAWGPRFFSSKNMVTQTHVWHPPSWDGARGYDATVEIGGISISITGGGKLLPVTAARTRYTLTLTLESSGRLAGSKLENGVAAVLKANIDAEHDFRERWLERQTLPGF
jgi:hypothetical protein